MEPFRRLGTVQCSVQPVLNGEEKRGCSLAWGRFFGQDLMQPHVHIHPATSSLPLSQLAQGWGSSRAQTLRTQAPQGALLEGSNPRRQLLAKR